jgi:hypothetical protein
LGEDILHTNLEKVLDTARAIVFIDAMYPDSEELWRLVVQKANEFVGIVISDEKGRKRLFEVLRKQLLGGREYIIQALGKDRWLFGYRFSLRMFNRILRSHLLDDPQELRRSLRRCTTYPTYHEERLIQSLDRDIRLQNTRTYWQFDGATVEDFDEWTNGWDDVLKLSLAIRSVIREMGFLEP